jgi:LCP family protein required for cell wall assembly
VDQDGERPASDDADLSRDVTDNTTGSDAAAPSSAEPAEDGTFAVPTESAADVTEPIPVVTEPAAPAAAEPGPQRLPGRSASARLFLGAGRTLVALVSVVVLAGTWYGWSTLRNLDTGIAHTDVIGTDVPGAASVSGGDDDTVPGAPLTSDLNILLVGMDSRTDPHGNPLPKDELAMLHAGPDDGELDTDTMMLVHIPAGGQQAVAISFPRDSYVQIAGGYGRHKLNSAFAYAHNAEASKLRAQGDTDAADVEQQADTAGRKNLIATINQLTGNTMPINRYAEVNLVGFYQLSQAVGGVQVCLKAPTYDDETKARFPAGVQTLQGVQALQFVRQRHGLPGGDLDRIVRQQVFLGALAHKILTAGTLTSYSSLNQLIDAVQSSVTLSNGWDITSFAAQMQNLTSGGVQFVTIPTGGNAVNSAGDVILVDPDQVQQFTQSIVDTGGVPGTGSAKPTGDAPSTTVSPTSEPPTAGSTGNTGLSGSSSGNTGSPGSDNDPITANGVPCVN